MSLFRGKRKLKILTLVSKIQLRNGRYLLSFDVIKTTDCVKEVKEKRHKESEAFDELPCMAASCSGDIGVVLSSKKCRFTFTVSGALKPATELETGEDVLQYNESMPENRRYLALVRTYDKASEGHAFIKFWHGEEVRHTVIIYDVSCTAMSSVVDSGSLTSLAENQKSPVDPASIRRGFADGDEIAANIIADDTAYAKILTEPSLQCLAETMCPKDSHTLLIRIGVKNDVIEQKKKDYPSDNVSAMFHCFLSWKNSSDQKTNKDLYEELLEQLSTVGRNDIKSKIEKVLTTNKELKRGDFDL